MGEAHPVPRCARSTHYFIGREGQALQTDVMIKPCGPVAARQSADDRGHARTRYGAGGLYRYMIHFLAIESYVTSAFPDSQRDPANYV